MDERTTGRRRPAGPGSVRGAGALLVLALGLSACTGSGGAGSGALRAVGAENEYADVISQIGGRYVQVSSVLDDPNTDPHTFESSPSVARLVSGAQLVVQNGLGYDGFMDKIESASPDAGRTVVVVQHLLGLPHQTPNPHLWYSPDTMPRVASAVAAALSRLLPSHASYFRANLERFDTSMAQVTAAVSAFSARYGGTAVATSEPVADDLLEAMGTDNLVPFRFQAAIMNGIDPAPQDISLVDSLFTGHKVKVFCYNEQVVDALNSSLRRTAAAAGIPVVGVYETMPTPGYDYQRWMLAEIKAVEQAVAEGRSTEHL